MDHAHHQCLHGSRSDSYPNYLSLSTGLNLESPMKLVRYPSLEGEKMSSMLPEKTEEDKPCTNAAPSPWATGLGRIVE